MMVAPRSSGLTSGRSSSMRGRTVPPSCQRVRPRSADPTLSADAGLGHDHRVYVARRQVVGQLSDDQSLPRNYRSQRYAQLFSHFFVYLYA